MLALGRFELTGVADLIGRVGRLAWVLIELADGIVETGFSVVSIGEVICLDGSLGIGVVLGISGESDDGLVIFGCLNLSNRESSVGLFVTRNWPGRVSVLGFR